MVKIGFGYSFHNDSFTAGKTAIEKILEFSQTPTFALIFNTYNYDQEEIIKAIRTLIPKTKILGCSCDGIIISDKLYKKGIGVLSFYDKNLKVETFLEKKEKDLDDYSLGEILGRKILKSGINKGIIFILADFFKIDISFLLHGLYNIVGKNFNFIGGGVGKTSKDIKAIEFTEKDISEGGVALAVIDGLNINTFISHGLTPIGDPLIISKSEGKEVIEIDGISAFSSYRKRLKILPEEEIINYIYSYPLGFPDLYGSFIIRDPVYKGERESIVFGTKMYENSVGYIMIAEVKNLINSTRSLINNAIEKLENPQFGIVISCISRAYYMKENFEKELKPLSELLLKNIPILGFLSFGEIEGYNRTPQFHNKTIVLGFSGNIKSDVRKEEKSFPLFAELSILHEISAFSLPKNEEDLYEEIAEKIGRFFNIQLFALLLKVKDSYKLVSSWGFKEEEEVLKELNEEEPNKFIFYLDEDLGVFYIEQKDPIDEKERKLYTMFAKKIESILKELRDIKRKKELEDELKKLSLTDELTNLNNRRGFLKLAEQQLRISDRIRKKSILIYIDLDNMKWINDNLGHKVGDKYLMDFADILRKSFRKSDIIARIGGDEFVVLCLSESENYLDKILSRLNKNIEIYNSTMDNPFKMSISIGISIYDPLKPISLEELLEIADKRMYEEKKSKKSSPKTN